MAECVYVGWIRPCSRSAGRRWQAIAEGTDEAKVRRAVEERRRREPWRKVVRCEWVVLPLGESPVVALVRK